MQQPLTSIKTPGYRRRRLAAAILARHATKPAVTNRSHPIKVVCISDTHNNQPDLPPGDILVHAGDLTENGSFDEVQAGITWLSSQPHPFKILIAGNHDVLFDEAFLQKYPERRYGKSKTKDDLDWGDVIYLQDSTITLDVPVQTSNPPSQPQTRKITIHGSPWTPQYGISAFQYPPSTGASLWTSQLAHHPDYIDCTTPHPSPIPTPGETTTTTTTPTPQPLTILITHGPPKLHLDRRAIHRAGCPYLLSEVARLRPRLHVFGHIHAAHGREDVVLDGVRQAHDDVQIGWGGWGCVAWMVVLVVWGWVKGVAWVGRGLRVTTFVNASVVGGRGNEVRNGAIVVEI
ncbi:Metallo-dependent phosphatase-like protein [Chaetomium tenue]|uniref:Metallo-dependent phosphatase-like protein n=1 Tax=Chaetomium tenue TaxID=1854479 RepID=A0ACB7PA88_9PEZI|nr:Metallo-dependent phosphatase-like protein [Chaetomium globosum]